MKAGSLVHLQKVEVLRKPLNAPLHHVIINAYIEDIAELIRE